MAAMIRVDLIQMDGCPPTGSRGRYLRHALESHASGFGPPPGPVRNKAELETFLEVSTERLRRLYEVVA